MLKLLSRRCFGVLYGVASSLDDREEEAFVVIERECCKLLEKLL